MSVSIVGGGIAGLSLAKALGSVGVRSTIFEQAQAFKRVGHSIAITPNGARVLTHLGLYDDVAKISRPVDIRETRNWDTGQTEALMHVPSEIASGKSPCQASFPQLQFLQRADLQKILHDSLDPAMSSIEHYNEAVLVTEERDAVNVKCLSDSGSHSHRAEVVVGCDGVHSVVRDYVRNQCEVAAPQWSGVTWVGGTSCGDELEGLVAPGTCATLIRTEPYAELTIMNTGPSTTSEEPCHNVYAWSLFTRYGKRTPESWSSDKPLSEAQVNAFAPGLCAPYASVLANAMTSLSTGIYARQIEPSFSHGRACLLGDAAHTFTPAMHQGCNQALEDSATLACLIRDHGLEHAEEVFCEYERRRRARVERVDEISDLVFQLKEEVDPDRKMVLAQGAALYSTGLHWLYNHDAWKHEAKTSQWGPSETAAHLYMGF